MPVYRQECRGVETKLIAINDIQMPGFEVFFNVNGLVACGKDSAGRVECGIWSYTILPRHRGCVGRATKKANQALRNMLRFPCNHRRFHKWSHVFDKVGQGLRYRVSANRILPSKGKGD